MTTSRNAATHTRNGREPPASPATGAPAPTGHRRRMFGAAALGVAALTAVGALAGGLAAGGAHAGELTNCAATPSSCGYPGTANTGVPSGTTLKSVPGQVSSGPGLKPKKGGEKSSQNLRAASSRKSSTSINGARSRRSAL